MNVLIMRQLSDSGFHSARLRYFCKKLYYCAKEPYKRMNLLLLEVVSISIVLGVVGVNNQNVEANFKKKNNTLQIKNEKNIS